MQNFEEFKQALKTVQETISPVEQHMEQESKPTNYMFFANLNKIKSNIEKILALNADELDTLLLEHDWAIDHMSSANENVEQVTEFLTNLK